MTDPFLLSDVVRKFKEQSGLSYAQLAERAGLPNKTTVSNWANGVVKRPRQWHDLVRLAGAMRLDEGETTELLRAAGYPSLAVLAQQATSKADRSLLSPWIEQIEERLEHAPFLVPHANPQLLAGRTDELEQIKANLLSEQKFCVLCGMGGVGKTTVAARIAYQLRPFFADGVLWATVKGHQSLRPILLSLAQAYGEEVGQYDDLEILRGIVGDILANKRALLILDNVQREDELRQVLPTGSACSVLVTTRNRGLLVENREAWVDIGTLSEPDSLALFAQVIGAERTEADRDHLVRIIEMMDGLPLALKVVARYLSQSQAMLTTQEYVASLRDAQTRLSTLARDSSRDPLYDVEACFELTYQSLSEPARALFPLLSIFPGTFSVESVAAAVAGDVKKRFVELNTLSLVEISEQGMQPEYAALPDSQRSRYELHALIRLFAARKVQLRSRRQLSPQQLRLALVDHLAEGELRDLCFDLDVDYQHLPGSSAGDKARELLWLFRREDRLDELLHYVLEQHPRLIPATLAQADADDALQKSYRQAAGYFAEVAYQNRKDGYRLLQLEHENILEFLRWAYQNQDWEILSRGVEGLTHVQLGTVGYLDTCGGWTEASELLQYALAAPAGADDKLLLATRLFKSGAFAFRQADFQAAEEQLRQSLRLLEDLPPGDEVALRRAYACEFMSQLMMMQNPEVALEWSERATEALAEATAESARQEKGYLQIRQGTILARSGKLKEGQDVLEQALRALPTYPTTAKVSGLMTLGIIHDIQGEYDQARSRWLAGLAAAEELGDMRRLAGLQRNLAIQAEKRGKIAASIEHNQEALRRYGQIGDKAGEGHTAANLAVVYLLLGDTAAAMPHVRKALRIADEQQIDDLQVFATVALARRHLHDEQLAEAAELLQEADKICRKIELSEMQAEIFRLQAVIARHRGRDDRAIELIEASLKAAEENGQVVETGSSLRVKGEILSVMGQSEAANDAFMQSQKLLAEHDHPLHRARTEVAWAEHHMREQKFDAAQVLLQSALETFVTCNAPRLAEHVKSMQVELV